MSQDQHWLGGRGQEFGLFVLRVAALKPPLSDFVTFLQDAVHGSNRTQVAAFVQ